MSEKLQKLQRKYVFGGAVILPFIPFLWAQGKYVRWRVGILPEATGETCGESANGAQSVKLLAIGESTVAGVGAKHHGEALVGHFANALSAKLGKSVKWRVIGKSGVSVRAAINEILPKIPADEHFDYLFVGLGGNDVFELTNPRKFRHDMTELLQKLSAKFPEAIIYLSNMPRVKNFTSIGQPLKSVLWHLSKLHHENMLEIIESFPNTRYYADSKDVDGSFFADGIHPSARGYKLWADDMAEFFFRS